MWPAVFVLYFMTGSNVSEQPFRSLDECSYGAVSFSANSLRLVGQVDLNVVENT